MYHALTLDGNARFDAQAILADLQRRNTIYVAERDRRIAVLDAMFTLIEPHWDLHFLSLDPDHGAARHVDANLTEVAHGPAEAAALIDRIVSIRDERRASGAKAHHPMLMVVVSPLDHLEMPAPRAPRPEDLPHRTMLELGLASLCADGPGLDVHTLVLTGELYDGLVDTHALIWRADVLRPGTPQR